MRYSLNLLLSWAIVVTLFLSLSSGAMAQSTSADGIGALFTDTKDQVEGASSLFPQSSSADAATSSRSLSAFGNRPSVSDIPDPEDAFTLSVLAASRESLIVRFDIMSCCYLYQERLSLIHI